MAANVTTKVNDLIARVATTEVKLERIEELLLEITARLPKPPAPPKPPKPMPGWPTSDGHNIGMNYNGEPTPCETVARGGQEWINKHDDGTWTDPFGQRRNANGEAIAHPGAYAPKPIGPQIDRQEQMTRTLVDRIALSFDKREEE